MSIVVTHWNSTFYMLDHLAEQKHVISLFSVEADDQDRRELNFTTSQWNLISHIVTLLKFFEPLTCEVSNKNAFVECTASNTSYLAVSAKRRM